MQHLKIKYLNFISIPLVIVGGILMFNKSLAERAELYYTYPLIEYKHDLQCKICSAKQDKASCLIIDNDSNMFRITAFNEDKNLFYRFAQSGDSIYKKAECEIVLLKKTNGQKKIFKLR